VPGAISDEALRRFADARVARLATVTADGRPHLVPVVFAFADGVVYTAVDGKPKSTARLKRLANVEHDPRVSVLVDHYDEDWSALWWVRADGTARILPDTGLALLRAKYEQYHEVSLDGPVIAVSVTGWASWSAH
jgi:PPOX class probable F420-dependent enzyme